MKTFINFLIAYFFRIAFWFRYRIKVVGLEKLNDKTLRKPGGILFLPNHSTVMIDAASITFALWPKFRLRPLIVEYMYYLPFGMWIMNALEAIPIPSFTSASNSVKRKKSEQAIQTVIEGLHHKQNFLIFPAGHTKQTAHERIDGASAVHQIIQKAPDANIVLVRVKGLWGSSFSRAILGRSPPLFQTIFQNIKHVFKNLIFFTPRRDVIIEFVLAPADFPYHASRLELNQYLEHWYDRPDGLRPQKEPYPGDSLIQISYSMWRDEYPKVWQGTRDKKTDQVDIESIPQAIQDKVIAKIAELTNNPPESIQPDLALTTDLGMDSLDTGEVAAFLQDEFEVQDITAENLTTVGIVMAIAAAQVTHESTREEVTIDLSKWKSSGKQKKIESSPNDTMPKLFLDACSQLGNQAACSDLRSGVVTYSQLKMRALILAEYIRHLPGDYIGIMLPASVAATLTILACQLAGKVPLMVNWTVGPRHLQAVTQLSNVQVVLSSWAFIDHLQNVELEGIDDRLQMLEDIRRKIGLKDKLKGFWRSKQSTKSLLKTFGLDKKTAQDQAVLLFTSGTESMPKGVPLTHFNLLSNQRGALEVIKPLPDDVIYSFLPPFHSFGFLMSLIGLLHGYRTAYSPDPTDGKRLAEGMERWQTSIVCGPPTFIKGIIKAASPTQLRPIRLCFVGAEKLPIDLVHSMTLIGKAESLLEGYGITECSPVLTCTPPGKPRTGVGQPLPGVELCVVDLTNYTLLPPGKEGLILARGPNVFSGYLTPGLASPFMTVANRSWYITGDLGHLDEAGNLILSGRLKRFVKIGGEMVSLAAVEEGLIQGALKKGWVTAKEEGPILAVCATELAGEKSKFFLFTRFNVSVDDVNKTLKEEGFSNLIRMTSVTQLDEIPVMGTGKVNYRKLEETYLK